MTSRPSPTAQSLAAQIAIGAVRLYQWTLSPMIGPVCRFEPSCSAYAVEALAAHGAIKGGRLAAGRLCRCHPWGGSGLDPVPAKR